MLKTINNVLLRFLMKFIDYLPDFFAGILILILGFFIAKLIKKILRSFFRFIKLQSILEKTRLLKQIEVKIWEDVLIEIIYWTIIILFLVPTLDVWRLNRATIVINQFLYYLPNVIIAVVIAFVGLLSANLGADLVKHSLKTIKSSLATTLSVTVKTIIIFFTVLIVLNQLGVAQDLIKILFTGIVAMLALAGGLAFGLGGQSFARDLIEEIRKKLL